MADESQSKLPLQNFLVLLKGRDNPVVVSATSYSWRRPGAADSVEFHGETGGVIANFPLAEVSGIIYERYYVKGP
jgi:hypothetical protein